jgi:hypothetical protein
MARPTESAAAPAAWGGLKPRAYGQRVAAAGSQLRIITPLSADVANEDWRYSVASLGCGSQLAALHRGHLGCLW